MEQATINTEAIKKAMIDAGIFFIFPKENELGYRTYLMVLDAINTVRNLGKAHFEANTTAGPKAKAIIYQFA